MGYGSRYPNIGMTALSSEDGVMNTAFIFVPSNRNDNRMDQHFCCYSASTEVHKLKGQRNYSFAVILNSSVDAEV